MNLSGIPLEHGMEVEQDGGVVPWEILEDTRGEYFGRWESDLSGPREFENLGPGKQVKNLVRRFTETSRQYDDEVPWEWHNETSAGSGCGSHAHITFADDTDDRDRFVEGMTIAWNTAVELTPFLAPFFSADWEQGFRSSISRWASPQLTRYSQSTMDRKVRQNNSRSYDSVTLSPREGSKPLTVELRLNEAHPAFALVGLTFLRRTMTKAMRGGWSPKLAGDRRSRLNELYRAIYQPDTGLVEAMQSVGPFRFEVGRGIPGSDVLEYETAWDVLEKIMAVNGIDRGAYDDHVKKLIQAAGRGDTVEVPVDQAEMVVSEPLAMAADGGVATFSGSELGPQNNIRAMWHTLDPDFEWDVGPEVESRY